MLLIVFEERLITGCEGGEVGWFCTILYLTQSK